jgi:hypothetical protein
LYASCIEVARWLTGNSDAKSLKGNDGETHAYGVGLLMALPLLAAVLTQCSVHPNMVGTFVVN